MKVCVAPRQASLLDFFTPRPSQPSARTKHMQLPQGWRGHTLPYRAVDQGTQLMSSEPGYVDAHQVLIDALDLMILEQQRQQRRRGYWEIRERIQKQ